jgi:SAM-dependent methyltransferase
MSRTRPQVPDCASADGGAGGEVSPRLSPTPRVAGGSWMEERVDNRGMTDSWEWDETLYAQSAGFYVAGRLAYPKQMAAQIVSAVGLGADSRALDVGCGPGSLTLLLAPLVDQIVGIDADAGMIAEARLAARRAGIGNVAWRRLRGEQLPAGLGDFDLATFAQSLHWMKRVEVLGLVRTMLREGGACVHVHATTNRGDESVDPLPRPRPPYVEIEALVRSYLGPAPRAGRSVRPSLAGGDEAEVYRAAGFVGPRQFTVSRGEVIERSIDQVVAATFSLSSSTPYLFADRYAEFETGLRNLLQAASDDDDLFCERARDVEFDVWRPEQHPT